MGFSTSSLYQAIAATRGSEELSQIWEIKLSLKIHIFCVHNLFMVGFLLGWRSASRTALEMGSVLCVVWMRTLIRYYFLVSRLNFYGVAFGQWLAAGDALQTFLTSIKYCNHALAPIVVFMGYALGCYPRHSRLLGISWLLSMPSCCNRQMPFTKFVVFYNSGK